MKLNLSYLEGSRSMQRFLTSFVFQRLVIFITFENEKPPKIADFNFKKLKRFFIPCRYPLKTENNPRQMNHQKSQRKTESQVCYKIQPAVFVSIVKVALENKVRCTAHQSSISVDTRRINKIELTLIDGRVKQYKEILTDH